MENIQLVQGHPVDQLLDEFNGLHVTRGVEHNTPPRKFRSIGNADAIQDCVTVASSIRRQQAPEGYRTVK
jgi:hypothetical protein